MIQDAAAGDGAARAEFARRYTPLVRAYLGARWRATPLVAEIDDAAQDVFLGCFRDGGVLTRVEAGRPGGFRAFLFGVVRNGARQVERCIATVRSSPTAG